MSQQQNYPRDFDGGRNMSGSMPKSVPSTDMAPPPAYNEVFAGGYAQGHGQGQGQGPWQGQWQGQGQGQVQGQVYGPPVIVAAPYPRMTCGPVPCPPCPQRALTVEFGSAPTRLTCPYCSKEIVTRTTQETSGAGHIACWALCLMQFWVLCCSCLLPLCMESFNIIVHYCPLCLKELGRHKPPGNI